MVRLLEGGYKGQNVGASTGGFNRELEVFPGPIKLDIRGRYVKGSTAQ